MELIRLIMKDLEGGSGMVRSSYQKRGNPDDLQHDHLLLVGA